MSTVPYTITAPTTGDAVGYYTIHQVIDGVNTDIVTSALTGSLTVPAGKTATVTVTATNDGGSATSDAKSVTAPAVATSGPNDLFMTAATYAAGKFDQGLSGGSGDVTYGMPVNKVLSFWVGDIATPPPAGQAVGALISWSDYYAVVVLPSGNLALIVGGGGTYDSGFNVSDSQRHNVKIQMARTAGSPPVFSTWIDGVFRNKGAYYDITDANIAAATKMTISAAGGTAPNPYYGARPGIGSIDEVAIFNGTPYTAEQATVPVQSAAFTGSETNLARLWHLNGSGASAV